jgi:ketosteroid isomerase-like protein
MFGEETQQPFPMSTRNVVESYFNALTARKEWSEFFREDVKFVSHVAPPKAVTGRSAFLDSSRRFYSMIVGIEVPAILIDGNRACALTRYRLQAPNGPSFFSEVAEIFEVTEGKISSLEIYFDSSPFPK